MVTVYIFLWLLTFFHNTDGKGGKEAKSLVSITLIGTPAVGHVLTLTCSYPSITRALSIFWFRYSDVIYHQEVYTWQSARVQAMSPNFRTSKQHTITLKKLHLDDDGIYLCSVKSDNGKTYEGSLTVTIKPTYYRINPKEHAKLDCSKEITNQSSVIIWQKDKSILVVNGTIVSTDVRYSVTERVNLKIDNVTDIDDGVYTCYEDGVRVMSYQFIVKKFHPPVLSALRGWRGYVFGLSIGFIIMATLATALYIQNRPLADCVIEFYEEYKQFDDRMFRYDD